MTFVTDLDTLDAKKVTDSEETIVQLLLEKFKTLDLNKGRVLRDLLVRPAALLDGVNKQNLAILRRSMSLAEIEDDPGIADDDTVDNVLSNFQLVRLGGVKTTGRITIVIDTLITTVIVSDTTFTSTAGDVYNPTSSFTGVTTAGLVIGTTDRLLRLRDDGKYEFTIEVESAVVGKKSIDQNARFAMVPVPARFVDAFAESDFTPGQDTETNTDLIARLKTGITAQTASGRAQIDALIRETFTSVIDVSIVGLSDAEMLRDKHNLFGISQGGKADIYVRTSALPSRTVVEKTATLVDAAKQQWRVSIGRDELPGFYRVESILLTTQVGIQSGTLTIVSDTRGLDITGTSFVPLITDVAEGVYSRYQTATIIFTDLNTDTTGLTAGVSTGEYTLTVSVMPVIDDIQSMLVGRSNRNPSADYLVRAPIPFFLAVEAVIARHPLDETISVDPIKQDIADSVNSLTFAHGKVSAAEIADVIHNSLPNRSFVRLPIRIWGTFRTPLGVSTLVSSTSEIIPTEDATQSISSRTVSFFLRVENIDLSVVTASVKTV